MISHKIPGISSINHKRSASNPFQSYPTIPHCQETIIVMQPDSFQLVKCTQPVVKSFIHALSLRSGSLRWSALTCNKPRYHRLKVPVHVVTQSGNVKKNISHWSMSAWILPQQVRLCLRRLACSQWVPVSRNSRNIIGSILVFPAV